MIKQIAHLCLRSTDLAETEKFYCQGLGMERFFAFEKEGNLFGYYLKAGNGTFVEVFQGDPGETGNINHMALEVEDMDTVLAHLQAQGIPFTEKKLGADQSWQAWLTDPSGVRIELHQYTPASSQVTGATCHVTW